MQRAHEAWAVLWATLAVGCTAIIGTRDLSFDPDAVDPGNDGSVDPTKDGGGKTDATTNTCGADLTSDGKNCGRCGHDCLGAACKASACDSIELAGGLDFPSGIAVDNGGLYVTIVNANVVVKVDKNTPGSPTTIATGQTNAFGIVVSGPTLFWTNRDFPYTGSGTSKGGLWKCTTATCATTIANVTSGDDAQNVQLANDHLYFVENNASQVKWLATDGSDVKTKGTLGSHPYGVAGDNQFVYFNSSSTELDRTPFDGGGDPVAFATYGPNYQFRGQIAIDGDYVYYTFTDSTGTGQVVGAPKDTSNVTKRTFGPSPATMSPLGMAFDDTYIYWSTGVLDQDGNPTGTGGDIRACHKTGCIAGEPVVLMSGLVSPSQLAVDQTALYAAVSGTFAAPGGSIRKVAKP